MVAGTDAGIPDPSCDVRRARRSADPKKVVDTRGKPEVIPMYLSRPRADRALRIMHALFTEAEGRGYTVEARSDL
ncbi:hypothetical protein [Streptomyces sp. NPDC018347]|uniref:hypothetical protein n=1 Tax=Streptomyces sp. NPDC018347 TaxID=3157193 RepID=UPI0033C03E82